MQVSPVSQERPAEPLGSPHEAVERAETYLRAHLDTHVPLSRLCRVVGVSERSLRNAFYTVHGIGPKPVILVDLVLNWMTPKNETLRVIRMRGDQFDPRRVLANQGSPTEALRAFVKTVLDRSNATALPDREAALGRPFASFEELAIYQRAVLFVEGPAQR